MQARFWEINLYSFGKISQDLWSSLVNSSPYASAFNRIDFLISLGNDLEGWGIFKDGDLLAAVMLQVNKNGGAIRYNETFNLYQGILISPAIGGQSLASRTRNELAIVTALLEGLVSVYDEFWLCLHPNLRDIRALQWLNYHNPENSQFSIDIRFTGIFDLTRLSSDEEIVSSFARGRKSDLKKAISAGVVVESTSDISVLEGLHAMTFNRQNQERGVLAKLLTPMTEAALKNGFGELLIAKNSDKLAISAALFIHDSRASYYLFGASDPAFRNSGAATLILTKCLINAFKRGSNTVDFVGINSPKRGEFKTSFGANPTNYFEAHWSSPQHNSSELPRIGEIGDC